MHSYGGLPPATAWVLLWIWLARNISVLCHLLAQIELSPCIYYTLAHDPMNQCQPWSPSLDAFPTCPARFACARRVHSFLGESL